MRKSILIAGNSIVVLGLLCLALVACRGVSHAQSPPAPTFTRDIAPLIFAHCSGCHRPGQPAPFSLLTYSDAKKRAADIVKATRAREMPPWLPEPGYGAFEKEQRLQPMEIARIERWVEGGALEGNATDLPPRPTWEDHWQLGKPDLIVRMPQSYQLASGGRDEYRNFVVATGLMKTRFVKGVEFRPSNPKIVHHAFVRVDRTPQSRRLDDADPVCGFPGLITPAEIPDGHFLGWQPGRLPSFIPEGLAWRLDPPDDIVLQMHLRKSGTPEEVQAEVGLYFTDQVPTNTPFRLQLASYTIDIPAGQKEYVVEDRFVLPIDLYALAILPHAHYLAREMRATATLPDGKIEPLIYIKNWNFEWHSDYRYQSPILLPAGSRVAMRYVYDNSADNPHNPHQPPRRVIYGPDADDEMAQLILQVLPVRKSDLPTLKRAAQAKLNQLKYDQVLDTLRKNPDDLQSLIDLSLIYLSQGKVAESAVKARRAVQVGPRSAAAHYQMGLVYRKQNQLPEAQREFETTLQFDPKEGKAHGNLAFIFLDRGELQKAREHLETAVRLNPEDQLARETLAQLSRGSRAR